ncbi:MAG: ferrous iron transport protein A [Bifidobacteriaceae bacterium]|nr:ferrous iron transport protein A [Bifidobacteriaceae bacterium]
MVHPPAEPLVGVEAGVQVVVERISDADPEMLRYFAAVNLVPDAVLTVAERRDFAGVVVLSLDPSGQVVELGDIAAAAIWVSRVLPSKNPD